MSSDLAVEERVRAIRARLETEAARVTSSRALGELRTLLFGRKAGLVTQALKDLGALAPAERASAGRLVNALRDEASARLDALEAEVGAREARARLAASSVDLTLPGKGARRGTRHPITLMAEELAAIFLEMGYALAEGPEVEDDFHNFEALNIPPEHPSRDMHDTLYVGPGLVLRTHTSNVQIRTMESEKPPIRVIAIGKCCRRDTPDLTHSPMFHQIEGLVVDEGISMAHLKGTLEVLARRLFGSSEVRLRPSYFPFTEPSAELDVSCFACGRRGCGLCKGSGWIELGGCGLVDPNVFVAVGIDPERWTGFAFGFGIERAAMLRHGIGSIRHFFENDTRFLDQFPYGP